MAIDAQWISLTAAVVAALASVIVTVLRAEGTPRDVRTIAKLAEALGHLDKQSKAATALDTSLARTINHYEARAGERRGRKLNKFNVTMTVIFGLAVLVGTYWLVNLALSLAALNVWTGIIGWLIAVLGIAALIILFAAAASTIYSPKSERRRQRSKK